MDTLVMEICECDDWELGDFPFCDFYFPIKQEAKIHAESERTEVGGQVI